MKKLKNKIKLLEMEIDHNRDLLNKNFSLLHNKMKDCHLVYFSMLTGFSTGLFIGSIGNKGALKEKTQNIYSSLYYLYRQVMALLPLMAA